MTDGMSERADDPRLGELMVRRERACEEAGLAGRHVALLGYAQDRGVALNGGRVGAREGPAAVQALLPKLGALRNAEFACDLREAGLRLSGPTLSGEANCTEDIRQLHEQHTRLVAETLRLPGCPFVLSVGGGNDQSFCNARAWLDHRAATQPSQRRLAVINVDAHLDVRPLAGPTRLPHSGSPFRQLIHYAREQSFELKLVEFGAQGEQCSAEHVDFVLENGGEVVWLSRLEERGAVRVLEEMLAKLADWPVFFSFDIDAIRGADCPGVSCPAVRGLRAREALQLCRVAGAAPNVRLMDISEFNPLVERDRTARLVCQMIYWFLLGYSKRFSRLSHPSPNE